MNLPKISCLLISLSTFQACTPAFQGEYDNPSSIEVISDKWNETDSRKTSEVLINSMVSKPWLENYRRANSGSKPVVIVADIENRTSEHIDTRSILESIRDEVINSGRVRFIDGKGRQKILTELKYQNESGMVSGSSAKRKGRQIGADFMLTGAISSNVQKQGGLKTVTYQTVLQLTNLETSELEWSEKYHIKKRFKTSGSSF